MVNILQNSVSLSYTGPKIPCVRGKNRNFTVPGWLPSYLSQLPILINLHSGPVSSCSCNMVPRNNFPLFTSRCTLTIAWKNQTSLSNYYKHNTLGNMLVKLFFVSTGKKKLKSQLRSRVQKFPAWHTKAAPNGKCYEGYIVPSMVRLMYQLKSVLK